MPTVEESPNVVSLSVNRRLNLVPTVDEISEQLEALPDKQRLVVDSIAQLGKFLMDNRGAIKYFVAVVAYREDDVEDPNELGFHVATSPIDLADYALALKILENSFSGNLNARNSMIK